MVHTNALLYNKTDWYYCIANNKAKKATQCDDLSADCKVGILTNALLNLLNLFTSLWNDLLHFFFSSQVVMMLHPPEEKKTERKNWTLQCFWTKRIQICKDKSYKKSTNINNTLVQCCISQHCKFDQKFAIVIPNGFMPFAEGQTLLDKCNDIAMNLSFHVKKRLLFRIISAKLAVWMS